LGSKYNQQEIHHFIVKPDRLSKIIFQSAKNMLWLNSYALSKYSAEYLKGRKKSKFQKGEATDGIRKS